jgi:hypothetical protein
MVDLEPWCGQFQLHQKIWRSRFGLPESGSCCVPPGEKVSWSQSEFEGWDDPVSCGFMLRSFFPDDVCRADRCEGMLPNHGRTVISSWQAGYHLKR